jgi:uncharacterized membrane protein (UPF0182 family)
MADQKTPWDDFLSGDFFDKLKKKRQAAAQGGPDGAKKPGKSGFVSNRSKIIIAVVVIILAIIIFSASGLATFFTDYLWFDEVGQTGVFWKVIATKVWVFFSFGALFFFILYLNVYLARRLTPKYELLTEANQLDQGLSEFRDKAGKWLTRGLLAGSVLIAILVGWAAGRQWEKVLKFFTYTDVGKVDPIFSKDIGFYMFRLPFLEYFFSWLFTVLIATLVITAAVHFLYGAINFNRKNQRFANHAKAHLSVLAGLILLVQAYRFRLQMFNTLFHTQGTFTGAHYSDVHALIPALWLLVFVSIACAILFIVNIYYKGWKLPAIGLATIVLVSVLAGAVYPYIIQNYVVKPKELARESQYIGYNIEGTQNAFNLQGDGDNPTVQNLEFPADQNLTYADIQANQATVRNIRLWDPGVFLQVLNQRQELRQEYSFTDTDVDRYVIGDGTYNQMLLSARELIYSQLPESARSWQNEHLSYTHGYSTVMGPSNASDQDGNPYLVIRDIPTFATEGLGIEVTRPELYFNETNKGYVIVRTGAPEIDYPEGSTNRNVEPYYEGSGGVQVSSFIRRLAFSIRFADVNLLLSGYVNSNSRLMFRRTISDRVTTVAPFLSLDKDPYMVVGDDGRLFWIQDAYTTSSLYPYSEYSGDINYMRNSVKVVIDAYNGEMKFFISDPTDAVVATYAKIFPDLFTDFSEMPEELVKHLRYPEDYFNTQMQIFKIYHMNEINAFYQKEDAWDIPTQTYGAEKGSQPLPAFYVILKLPGEEKEEMVLMLPFNPRGKSNMVNWVVGRCDVPNYGKLINFSFPSNKLVTGTQQFESLVDQTTSISEQFTLWNQSGSRIIRGNTLVIPIETSLIYVEPLYLMATNPAIPQLKRVIVSDGKNVTMAETLDGALRQLFGVGPSQLPNIPTQPTEPGQQVTTADLINQATQLYSEAEAAQRAGDWATYGDKIKKLGDVLNQLSQQNP